MAKKRFVIQKVGDQFVPVPAEACKASSRALCGTWGAVLTLVGMRHRGLAGLALMAAGGGLIYRAATGRNPLQRISALIQHRIHSHDAGPSYQHDLRSPSSQQPEDDVDEAVMESFPASDPPTRSVASA